MIQKQLSTDIHQSNDDNDNYITEFRCGDNNDDNKYYQMFR